VVGRPYATIADVPESADVDLSRFVTVSD
jgi:hypothetical protein